MRNVCRRSLASGVATWVLAMCSIATDANATLLFTPADPALAGATIIPLDSTIGLAQGQLTHTTVQNGVTITFTTASPSGFFDGAPRLATYWPDGVLIEFNPPVGAVGVVYSGAECAGQASFDGSANDENFMFQFGAFNLFVGAANIGDISSVLLNGTCFAAWWSEMHFVPSSGPPPTDEADLSLVKRPTGFYTDLASTTWELITSNAGPDTATGVQAIDFLPQLSSLVTSNPPATILNPNAVNPVAAIVLPDLPSAGSLTPTIEVQPPPFGNGTYCNSALINYALATGTSLDLNGANNDWTSVLRFDDSSRFGASEICTNAYDDDCDGRPDCADSECASHPRCRPPTPPSNDLICWGGLTHLPGVGVIDSCGNIIAREQPEGEPGTTDPPATLPNSDDEACEFPTACSNQTLSMDMECCERPANDLDRLQTAQRCVQDAFAQLSALPPECQISQENTSPLFWMGMPVDPNFKEADPAVNVFGHGITSAGQQITYTLHYENIGTADAHDVVVLDVLSPELDDSTIVINDGGTYDSTTRVLRWLDPVLPPNTPRSVRFSINVRADAPLGTRIRNTGTIIFPDAVPPSRIDTNFVEHVIPLPEELPVVDPSSLDCVPAGPDQWRVRLGNSGTGFGYNASAQIVDGPPTVIVTDDTVRFSHVTDPDPATRATLAPASYTESDDVVILTTPAPGDPCLTLTWRIRWESATGEPSSRDLQPAVDADADGVRDTEDVCPTVSDPAQIDTDADGAGDACDGCPDDPAHTGACPTPTPSPTSTPTPTPAPSHSPGPSGEICGNCLDDDGDGKVDVADSECSGLPLALRRGVIKLPTREDRDRVVLRGSFAKPTTSFDPPATGASVSLFEGDRLVACYPIPAGEGWKTNRRGTRWVFRDARDDGYADPEANERLRMREKLGRIHLFARIKEIDLEDLTSGLFTASVTVGEHITENAQLWRSRAASRRLVTP